MAKPKSKQPPDTSGYPESQPRPQPGKPRLPGKGTPHEPQNMPEQKPGKGGS